jgi:hypothetical protein
VAEKLLATRGVKHGGIEIVTDDPVKGDHHRGAPKRRAGKARG